MAPQIPTSEPTEIVAGDSVQFDVSYPDYPASEGWELSYAIRGPVDADLDFGTEVTADGDGFSVRASASVTEPLTEGTYTLIGFATKASDRHTVYREPLVVTANPETEVGAASHDERVLAVIDAALEGRLTTDREEFTINGRSVKHIPIEELVKLQGQYRARIIAARNPDAAFGQVEVGFVAPR